MSLKSHVLIAASVTTALLLPIAACTNSDRPEDNFNGLTIKLLVGSALDDFCDRKS